MLQLKPSAAAKLRSIISGNVVGQGEFDSNSLRYIALLDGVEAASSCAALSEKCLGGPYSCVAPFESFY